MPYGEAVVPDAVGWDQLLAEEAPLEFEPVDFDHPLYVLFSSGTTGLPKAIVHGHGGQLIEHHKNQGLGWDLKPGGRLQWFSTTAWMMWNALVSALLLRSSIVMLDGDPAWPDLLRAVAAGRAQPPDGDGRRPAVPDGLPQGGAAARPRMRPELAARPVHGRLAAARRGLPYVYEQLGPDVVLINGSGGTDVCTGMVSGSFGQPVYEGEISGPLPGRRRARLRRGRHTRSSASSASW